MDGVGDLTVYHAGVFSGGLRGHRLLVRENDVLWDAMFESRILPHLAPLAAAIQSAADKTKSFTTEVIDSWINTIYRLCIGLRRLGTGGTLLITPNANSDHFDIGYEFGYTRFGDSVFLSVLDEAYRHKCWQAVLGEDAPNMIPYGTIFEATKADGDIEDRRSELTGAVKVVTSLASVDGLVLVTPLLRVRGFGVKIKTSGKVGNVCDGVDFVVRGTNATIIDVTKFGTRHNSVLRYCRVDKDAIGVTISQDGHVRIAATSGRSLVLWDNVKLLNYRPFTQEQIQLVQEWVKNHMRRKRPKRGYTNTPKTLGALLRILNK